MKNRIKLILAVVALSGALVSCETYDIEPDNKVSNVAPLDGRWICYAYDYTAYNANPATATRLELVEIYSSGTSDNAADKLWLHIGYMLRRLAINIETLSIKVDCNTQSKTFGISNATTQLAPNYFATPYFATTHTNTTTVGGVTYRLNLHRYAGAPQSVATISMDGLNVSITEGVVTVDGFDTPTGYKSDHIKFVLELSGNPNSADNYKYVIEGHRHTGWADDYNSTYDTPTAHQKWNIPAYVEEWIYDREGVWPIPYYVEPQNTKH